MSDPVTASTNLTKRGSTYQFVLRVPKDLVPEIGKARIQFSLGTSSEIEARRLALPHAETWEARTQELRAKKGLVAERPVAGALDTTDWTWPEWKALAKWIGAQMLDEDYEARIANSPAVALIDQYSMEPLGNPWLAQAIRRSRELEAHTMVTYAEQCLADVQRAVTPVGIRVDRGSRCYTRFMAACLESELGAISKMIERETRREGFDHVHPDAIPGPWRKAPARAAEPIIVPAAKAFQAAAAPPASGHRLLDRLDKWKKNRKLAKKPINRHLTADMENTFARFHAHAGTDDIGQITRKQLIDFVTTWRRPKVTRPAR